MNIYLRRVQPSLATAAFLIANGMGAATAVAQTGPGLTPTAASSAMAPAARGVTNAVSLPTVLVQGEKIAVTTHDVLSDVKERVPAEAREQFLSRSSNVSQVATNLYARRAMAAEAEAVGLGRTPEVEAALRVARDRVLSDAWIARIDAQHQVSDAVAERLGQDMYRAQPDRFMAKDQVRIRHILITGDSPESRARAEKLLEELKAGGDFAKLAEANSADTASAARGGDLGFFEAGRMVPEFEQAAFALQKPGDLGNVVKTQFGYHVLQLQERKPAGRRPFEEVRADIVKEIRGTVAQEARVEEAKRLQQGLQVNKDAIAAFSSGFQPADVQMKP